MKIFLATTFLSLALFGAEQNSESKRDNWTQAQINMIKKSYSELVSVDQELKKESEAKKD